MHVCMYVGVLSSLYQFMGCISLALIIYKSFTMMQYFQRISFLVIQLRYFVLYSGNQDIIVYSHDLLTPFSNTKYICACQQLQSTTPLAGGRPRDLSPKYRYMGYFETKSPGIYDLCAPREPHTAVNIRTGA